MIHRVWTQCLNRFKRPKTVVEALERIVSPELVGAAAQEVSTHDLIDYLAQELFINSDELLCNVANKLQLGALTNLAPPDQKLLSRVGHSPAVLQELNILPQRSVVSQVGYVLVVSDPASISLSEFEAQGVTVLLGNGRQIFQAWQDYLHADKQNLSKISRGQLCAIMKRLAADAQMCGGQEVFIGHPLESQYEFIAGENRYCGKLHPDVYQGLLAICREDGTLAIEAEGEDIDLISVALTRNFERVVGCLTWSLHEKPNCPTLTTAETVNSEIVKPKICNPKVVAKTKQAAKETRQLVAPAQQPRVLLVDDDGRFALIVTKILKSKSWDVTHCQNGRLALELIDASEQTFDLIICDVHMPEMDGPTFLERIQSQLVPPPVIMLTSDSDELLEAELAMLGANAFVRKQDDPRVLMAWCNNLLTKSKQQKPKEIVVESTPVNSPSAEEVAPHV